ncbi:MAG TPA: isoprenylcysteine carboxylmethyltransferase family protein [Woeseiaceae bacterium]|nr:isoprenylcysteine carboxylmethyltransferase family protein [Woeseiaceae bacterium]
MLRIFILAFSLASYLLFLLVFLYLLGFLANIQTTALAEHWPVLGLLVPISIDYGREVATPLLAFGIDLGLIALFGLQHSIMARQGFKRWWTRWVPAAAERAVYVLVSSLVLMFFMWQWRPIPAPVLWQADALWSNALGWSVLALGVAILLFATFLIDHFELFGLKQAWCEFRAQAMRAPKFATPLLYRIVRHPIYAGWLLIFWGTPFLTAGHLLFALGMSSYIFMAIPFEERDLIAFHGDEYRRYKEQVPMVCPVRGRARNQQGKLKAEGL